MSAFLVLVITSFYGQEEKKKFKKPKFNIGEKLGDLAGSLMTSKTSTLAETSPVASLVIGVYNAETGTSESTYFSEGTAEGDHMMSITFFKNDGVGLLKLEGGVKALCWHGLLCNAF